jgi:sulfur carrier protein
MSIVVSVNNEKKSLSSGLVLSVALQDWGYECKNIAVAINGEFVPRSQYVSRVINEDDCLDVLAPVQGG